MSSKAQKPSAWTRRKTEGQTSAVVEDEAAMRTLQTTTTPELGDLAMSGKIDHAVRPNQLPARVMSEPSMRRRFGVSLRTTLLNY